MEKESEDFLFETAKRIWDSKSVSTWSKESTTALLKELKYHNQHYTITQQYDMMSTVKLTKELVDRYNNNKMDKYKLQFIQELAKVPKFILPLVKLNETI